MQNYRCAECKNYLYGLKCLAFDQIPEEILNDENDHAEPLPGQDNTIVFEPLNDTDDFDNQNTR